jgi:DNA adenine methylase
LESLPKGNRLVEPFAGSGAVFLNAHFAENIIADGNADLINLYQAIQNDGLSFIEFMESWFEPCNNEEHRFYELREIFNSTTDKQLKSALFVYLNRHCFNGLCRYNSKGGFNVPFGRYTKPSFPKKELMDFWIKSKSAQFYHQDFRDTLNLCLPGDVVYCDPPYAPLTDTASFSDYTKEGFTLLDQQDLANQAARLKEKRIPVIISNHDTFFTRNIYRDATLEHFSVRRFIASNAANRANASELIASYV